MIKMEEKSVASEHNSKGIGIQGSRTWEDGGITEPAATHEPCIHICSKEKTDPPTHAPQSASSKTTAQAGVSNSAMKAQETKKESTLIRSKGGMPGS